ncbi:K1C18 protein, partial [Pachycephala philippinensis]|nr:K1C18 protein [Pachycephala philippinensis]
MRERLCWAEMGTGLAMAGAQGHGRDRKRAEDKEKVTNGRKAGSAPCPIPAPRSGGVPRFEAELAIRLSVDGDIAGLRKEVQDLRAQVSQSALTVEVDAPQSQDLGKVLGELRAQYDALAQKNLEDLEKQWGQQVQIQVSAAEAELRELRAQLQRQNEQHRELLGLKDRLEAEIATYRQL